MRNQPFASKRLTRTYRQSIDAPPDRVAPIRWILPFHSAILRGVAILAPYGLAYFGLTALFGINGPINRFLRRS